MTRFLLVLLSWTLTMTTLFSRTAAFMPLRPMTSSSPHTTHAMQLQDMEHMFSSALTLSTEGPPEVGGVSYSKASYYTILGLYVLSFPGVWSQVKRSTSAKIKRKTFVTFQKTLRQQAGEIMAYMTSNNYEVVEAGETITFRGVVKRSLGQAAFLVFCTALGLLSLALVLQVQFHDVQLPYGINSWYWIALLSPYAGVYYWSAGDRVDEISVKLVANADETENEIIVQGNDEELERMWRTLEWTEKGMVKVPGILEQN